MRLTATVLLLAGLFVSWGCDQPDEVYKELPSGFDPDTINGLKPVGHFYEGSKGFDDPTLNAVTTIPTTEVCTDSEIVSKQVAMIKEPIIPMVGAGGLDMTGGADWSGLTIDDVQSPEMLCQALYYGDGIAAWGDYFELVAFWDTDTRKIDGFLIRPGYEGTIEAGDFEFEVNEAIRKDGSPMSRSDGSERDPRTDDNMRAMDRALIDTFRPGLDSSEVDCVDAGSCYILVSGTLPVLVFSSVNVYVTLEPQNLHIVNIQVYVKRPFSVGAGRAEIDGITPTITGTASAGIADCEVTFGTPWGHIEDKCLGDDPLAMSSITAANGYENVVVAMGGVVFVLERPGLADDEILPLEPEVDRADTVNSISISAGYEGEYSMPFSQILETFKSNVDAAIRAEVDLAPEELTGVERLRTPDDPALPADVIARYPERLRPGAVFVAYCDDDGPDADDLYDSCMRHSSGRPVLPLVSTLKDLVSAALGTKITPKLSDAKFYVQHFERALGEYFNGGPLGPNQINYMASSSGTALQATISIHTDAPYTVVVYYGGDDDRLHFTQFTKGTNRMENVLFQDAALPTQSDPAPSGVFTFNHLVSSPRMGLGTVGTISIGDLYPETRRAMVNVKMSSSSSVDVLAPYTAASTVSGYWIPVEGPHSTFVQADIFQLYGSSAGAAFWLVPDTPGSDELRVAAVAGSSFFGQVGFCGFGVKIGDYADELLSEIQDANYPCEMIVDRSENREFITSITDMDSQTKLYVTNNLIDQVFVWAQ